MVTWTKQIKNVLKSDPDEPLKQGLHVGPETELNFWTERANNLNSIHQQLLGESVQKIVTVLKLAHSTYHPAYLRLADEVEKAKARANDNVKLLAPLKPRLEKVLYRCRATPNCLMTLLQLLWTTVSFLACSAPHVDDHAGMSSMRYRACSSQCFTH